MAAIVIILALAAAVWALDYAWRGSLLLGSVASLLLGYVFTHHFWRLGIGPVSLTVGRLLIAGLVLVLVWRWWQGLVPRRPIAGSDWLVALFVGFVTCSYLVTPLPVGIEPSVSATWRIIACFWMPAAAYLVLRCADFSERNWKLVLAGLSCFGVYLAVTGIAEVYGQWWAVFPRYISDSTLGPHFGRARGPALNSVSLGMFLVVCFWAAWLLWSRVGRCWRIVLPVVMGLMCVGLYFTYTRSSWLALAATLAVIPLLQLPRAWRPVLLTGTQVVGLLGAVFVGGKLINMDRHDVNGPASHSVYQRESFLLVSMRMFADNPLTGCGFGRFYDRKLPYLADRSQQIELESIRELDHHNAFLSLLTETGLVGMSLFMALLVAWGRAAWQLARAGQRENWERAVGLFALAVLAVYAANAMFHDLTLLPSEQWLLFLAAGAAVGLQGSARARDAASTSTQRPRVTPRQFSSQTASQMRLFGMAIDVLDMAGAVETILQWHKEPAGTACRYVVTPNVDHVVQYQTNTGLREAYQGASLVLADGAPVVAASWLLGKPLPERVAGSDLVPALFDAASKAFNESAAPPLRVFLLGAAPEVAERAARRIHQHWPGVDVVGKSSPPSGFENDPSQNERILQAIADTQPDLVLIGLGAPKQELWVARHAERLSARAALCVGATIDFLAGEKARSPKWMRHLGLEWLHRWANEPSRLAHRYLCDAWIFPQLVWRELSV